MPIPGEFKADPFTVAEARGAGLTWESLQTRVWRRMSRGQYAWTGLRHDVELILRAVDKRLPERAAFSVRTAAWIHGLDVLPCEPIEVTVPRELAVRSRSGVRLRRASLPDRGVTIRRGFRVTTPLRTACDLGSCADTVEATVALDMALHAGLVDMRALNRHVDSSAGAKGIKPLSRDYPNISRPKPLVSRDYPNVSRPKPSVSRDYPNVSRPKSLVSRDYPLGFPVGSLRRRRPPPPFRRRRPQALQVVVRPLPGQEDVREHGIEVEQDPPRVLVTVDRQRPAVSRLRRLHHPVGDRAHLAVGLAFADDEVVGDRCLIANVDHDRVPGLFLGCGALQHARELQRRESPFRFGSQPIDYPCRGRFWRCSARPIQAPGP